MTVEIDRSKGITGAEKYLATCAQFKDAEKRTHQCRAGYWVTVVFITFGAFITGKGELVGILFVLMGMGGVWCYGSNRIEKHIKRDLRSDEL